MSCINRTEDDVESEEMNEADADSCPSVTNDNIETEQLTYDESAYIMYHRAQTGEASNNNSDIGAVV
jgi:hypothetical protein